MYFIVSVGDNSFLLLPFEVKVLQCIRILETSPVMTKLISALFLSSNSRPKKDAKSCPPLCFRSTNEAAIWAANCWTWTLLGW